MILHMDMDAFFASVEQRDNPGLKGKPLVVSGHSKRSVVSTASYEARRYGIHSAMPVFQALALCPHLIILPGNRHKYARDSQRIMALLRTYSPLVEQVSIDEAFMDITGCQSLFGTPEQIARKIKSDIKENIGLTCSIGIAPVRFLAKVASDLNKPDGLTIIPQDRLKAFIRDLPIEKVPGVGTKAMAQMRVLRIRTLGDVTKFDPRLLTLKLGKMGTRLHELALGIDNTPIETEYERKSISSETTLPCDISDPLAIRQALLAHAEQVGNDLRRRNWLCRHVSLKIKFSDFSLVTRGKVCSTWISSSHAIYKEAVTLLDRISIKKKIRLLGVGVSDFTPLDAPVQMSLLPDQEVLTENRWKSVDQAVDAVLLKFGPNVVQKASLRPSQPKRKSKERVTCFPCGPGDRQDRDI